MKKFLFFALLFPLYCSAQSLQNLDVKNGFLQFHLGDSISVYNKQIYVAYDKLPDENEVKTKAVALRKYIDKISLVNKNGVLTEIDVYIRDEQHEQYIDQLMTEAYGNGTEIPNLDKYQEGTHVTFTTWTGRRVSAMIVQNNINRLINGHMTHARIQVIIFKKISDFRIAGDLPAGFML